MLKRVPKDSHFTCAENLPDKMDDNFYNVEKVIYCLVFLTSFLFLLNKPREVVGSKLPNSPSLPTKTKTIFFKSIILPYFNRWFQLLECKRWKHEGIGNCSEQNFKLDKHRFRVQNRQKMQPFTTFPLFKAEEFTFLSKALNCYCSCKIIDFVCLRETPTDLRATGGIKFEHED